MEKGAGIASHSTILCLRSARWAGRLCPRRSSMQLQHWSACLSAGAEVGSSRQDAARWPSVFWHGSEGSVGTRPDKWLERSCCRRHGSCGDGGQQPRLRPLQALLVHADDHVNRPGIAGDSIS